MKQLRVDLHPNKTWLGQVKRGFDCLGFRMSPTTIQPSAQSVSRRDSNIARLYEQGADKKRIGQYLRRWSGWVVFAVALIPAGVHANAGTAAMSSSGGLNCAVSTHSNGTAQLLKLQFTYGQWAGASGTFSDQLQFRSTEADNLDFTNCTYTLSVAETSDSLTAFSLVLDQTSVNSTNQVIKYTSTVDIELLATKDSGTTYEAEYTFTLTGAPR